MAIGGLFPQNRVVTEDKSLLKERWGQDGSEVVNYSAGTRNTTIHTVTTGKTYYVNQIILSITQDPGGSSIWYLKDGGAAGTVKISLESGLVADSYVILNLATPIAFTTDVYIARNAGDAYTWTISGWEE